MAWLSAPCCWHPMSNPRSHSVSSICASTPISCPSELTEILQERPGHSAAILLAVVGISLILVSRLLAGHVDGQSSAYEYTAVPLQNVRDSPSPRPSSPTIVHDSRTPLSTRQLRLAFAALVLAICLRVETIRRIVNSVECPSHGYAVRGPHSPAVVISDFSQMLLPLLFATLDWWRVHRHESALGYTTDDMDDSVYDMVHRYWINHNFRYIAPSALLALSSTLIFRLDPTPGSTFICPATTLARYSVGTATLLALPLDFCIIFCIDCLQQTSFSSSSSSSFPSPRKTSIGRPLGAIGLASLVSQFVDSLFSLGFKLTIVSCSFRPSRLSWVALRITFYRLMTVLG